MRQFHYIFLFLFFFFAHSTSAQVYDWLLIYYMPYDNNLSPLSPTIISQLKNSTNNDKVAVVLQTDLADKQGMIRYTFHQLQDSVRIPSDASASASVFSEYLTWVSDRFKARHYVIILLNHGGHLMEYGLDEYPEEHWMSIDSVALSIRKFNQQESIHKLDLLFEQVCARGTLENLYEFKDVAAYTLASQGLVPAPGYYYQTMLQRLASGNIQSGNALADIIVAAERPDMYYSFSLIDNKWWASWSSAMAGCTKQLKTLKPPVSSSLLKVFSYGGEAYYDFSSVLASIGEGQARFASRKKLSQVTFQKLVNRYYLNKTTDQMKDYSGLSIYSPFRFKRNPLAIYDNADYAAFIHALEGLIKQGR